MALAFMLNPRKKKRAKSRRKRSAKQRRWIACVRAASGSGRARMAEAKRLYSKGVACGKVGRLKKRAARLRGRRGGGVHVKPKSWELPKAPIMLNNPKGGRKMASKTKRRKARRGRRPRAKMYRNRKGRFTKRKTGRRVRYHGRGRKRGWWNPRGKRRKNARRRRNPAPATNPRRKRNARRRRNSMYSGRLYASNPRHRRRRRNPLGGTIGAVTRRLTDPRSLTQFAVAAAGATVTEFAGSLISSKLRSLSPGTFVGTVGALLDAAVRIAAAALIGSFLPARFQTAFILGGGAIAAKPLVDMVVGPALSATGLAVPVPAPSVTGMGGIGAWISIDQARQLQGVGAWITSAQMPFLGTTLSGLRGVNPALGYAPMRDYAAQPGMASAFTM